MGSTEQTAPRCFRVFANLERFAKACKTVYFVKNQNFSWGLRPQTPKRLSLLLYIRAQPRRAAGGNLQNFFHRDWAHQLGCRAKVCLLLFWGPG